MQEIQLRAVIDLDWKDKDFSEFEVKATYKSDFCKIFQKTTMLYFMLIIVHLAENLVMDVINSYVCLFFCIFSTIHTQLFCAEEMYFIDL